MSEKIYCGSGKTVGKFNQIKLNICIDDIPTNYVTTGKNGKRYTYLLVGEKRQVDQFGNSHSVEVDTWKPSNGGGNSKNSLPENNKQTGNETNFDNLDNPFN